MDYNGLVEIVNESTTLETGYTIASQSAKVGTGTFLLEDNRDDKTYLVRRLADGNCWMVQNLDLNLANFTSDKTDRLTSENTNIEDSNSPWIPDAKMRAKSSVLETGGSVAGLTVADYQFQDYKNYGQELKWGSVCAEGTGPLSSNTSVACSSISVANNANSSWARSYNNDDASGSYPAYLDGTSNVTNPTECAADTTTGAHSNDNCAMPGRVENSSMNAGTYTATTSPYNGLTKDSSWQPGTITTHDGDTFTMRGSMYIGDYYNWYAATAEVGQFSTGTTVTQDICPKGWRLPVDANENGSWVKLIATTYGLNRSGNYSSTNRTLLNKIMQLPLSIPMSGVYNWANGALDNRGYGGYYWSSTASGGVANYLGFLYSGWFLPQNSRDKVSGLTIRCVNKGSNHESVVSTCGPNKVCYHSNGGSGTVADQTVTPAAMAADTTAVLSSASTLSRDGYYFAGWADTSSGYSDIHMPGETVTVGDLTSAGKTYFAKWVKGSKVEGPTPVASFNDGADGKPMEVKIAINPVQEGSGDPSPDNVRPITGWTSAKITRTGRNLYVGSPSFTEYYNVSNWSKQSETYNGHEVYKRSGAWAGTGKRLSLQRGTYTLSAMIKTNDGANIWIPIVYDGDEDKAIYAMVGGQEKASSTSWTRVSITFTVTTAGVVLPRFERLTEGDIYISEYQLEVGSSATEYEPYAGETTEISFPQAAGTVYGGELTIYENGTGKLSVTHKMTDLGDYDWEDANSGGVAGTHNWTQSRTGPSNAKKPKKSWIKAGLICDHYLEYTGDRIWADATVAGIDMLDSNAILQIRDDNLEGKTAAEVRTYLTGTKVVYPLATPITYDLSSAEVNAVLTSLEGTNNVWADTGDILYAKYHSLRGN